MPCTKVIFYPLNSASFLSAEMSKILKKSKNRPKIQFAMESDKTTFQTVHKYVFFSLRYSMARFTVFFVFKRSSNNTLCGARETDVGAVKPILSPFT